MRLRGERALVEEALSLPPQAALVPQGKNPALLHRGFRNSPYMGCSGDPREQVAKAGGVQLP